MEDPQGGQVPLPRLPTVVTTPVIQFFPFYTPIPSSQAATDTAAVSTQQTPSAGLLHAVCGALLSVDTSNLQPRWPEAHFSTLPGTLQHALTELNPLVFRMQPVSSIQTALAVEQPSQNPKQPNQPNRAGKSRPAPSTATAETQQATKRRKVTTNVDEVFISRAVDGQKVAATVARDLEAFLQNSARSQEAAGTASAQHARLGARSNSGAQQHLQTPLDSLKQLHSSLAAGRQAGILAQLDQHQLRQLLLLLLDHVRIGQEQLLDEHATVGSDTFQSTSTAVEAACCCMQVLSAAGMHSSLYVDELMTATINLAKYHLQYNVLALHDPQFKRLYRPSAEQDVAAPSKRKGKEATNCRVPKALAGVQSKLELLLSLLCQVAERIVLEVEVLLPLVRVALSCLSVDGLQLLQAQAVALTVSVFRAYPEQRESVVSEIFSTVVDQMHIHGKAPARLFEATGAALAPLPVTMTAALLVQLVQVSVELPEMDAEAASIGMGFRAAFGWSDFLWNKVFDRLPAAKAAKSEGATDFKLVMQTLVADMLAMQMLPEWPAANIMLRRLIKQLASEKGLKHKDSAVKLACVEIAGQLAAALCTEALAADGEAAGVQSLKEAAQATADPAILSKHEDQLQQLPDILLLDYLAATWGCSESSSSSSSSTSAAAVARRFVCCRMLHDAVHAGQQCTDKEQKELVLLLVQHRKLQESSTSILGDAMSAVQPNRIQVMSLLRQSVTQGPLGRARAALLKWLLEAGSRTGPDPSPALVRTKVFKCLGTVVEADARIMALPEVAVAVHAAQEDDSAAVKEAVLELLVKLINTNPELAGQYFEALVNASYDQGILVRKRAIRALWECCSCPGFSRAGDAVVAVLQRADDSEESMRNLVTKICGEMWFTDASSFAGLSDNDAAGVADSTRTASVRATELATVSLRLYEAGGKNIHVPLPPEHGLIVIFREVLGTGSSSAVGPSKKELKEQALLQENACQVAQALLEMVLQQQQQDAEDHMAQDTSSGGCFQYLMALHALSAADPRVVVPAADAQRFVRCLAPYVSNLASAAAVAPPGRSSAGAARNSEEVSRTIAEEGVCLMAVLDAVLRHVGCIEQDVGQQLTLDIVAMLAKQRYQQVISTGCQLLCTLAHINDTAAGHIPVLVQRVYNVGEQMLTASLYDKSLSVLVQRAPRVLFLMGQLCRYGASQLDGAASADTKNRSCAECLEMCVSLWHRADVPPDSRRVLQDSAMTAIGLIIIGSPGLLLQSLHLKLLEHQHSAGPATTTVSAHSRGSGDAGSPEADSVPSKPQSSTVMHGLLSGVSVVRVYTSVLSNADSNMALKSKVLNNLVDLLRAEEAAVLLRQKEAEAAGVTGRLPSTLPADSKAPLARVNGQNDAAGGSGSSCIIQCVWTDVLRLATGVAAGGMEAANTRKKALELIEVVLRGGLVAPWDAVPPLVAQLTDELPETRVAALRVLKSAAEKYTEYVVQQLPQGILEAYNFQSRLWEAKHPGQPLPKGPSLEVLDSLSAMYAAIVQPAVNLRQSFLKALVKPFKDSCSVAVGHSAAGREDPSRLAFLAYVAANLPYKRADEPLALLHVINSCISQMAQEVQDVLRRNLLRLGLRHSMGLDEDEEEDLTLAAETQQHAVNAVDDAARGLPAGAVSTSPDQHKLQSSLPLTVPLPLWLAAPVKASLGLSMLLVLKQYITAAYGLVDERVAQYEFKGEKARAEAKAMVNKSKKTGEFSLSVINLRAVQDGTGELLAEQYKTFAALLDNDAANYREAAVLAALDDDDGEDDEGAAAAAAAHGSKHPSATPAAAAGLVVYSMEAKSRSARGRGGRGTATAAKASTGNRTTTSKSKGTARGTGTTGRRGTAARSSKKKAARRASDSGDEDDDDSADDGDWGSTKAAKARKLFH